MSPGIGILIGVLLLAANAFFVGAEFAVMSARRSAIEPLAQAGSKRAKTALYSLEHVTDMLATAQLGVTFCSTTLGLVAEPAIAHLIEGPLVAMGLPAATSHLIGFVLALTLVVYLHVVVGEMVPKNISIATPERSVLLLAPPLVFVTRVLRPLISAMNGFANWLLRLVGVEPKREVASAFTAEEVASIVERSQAEGVLEDDLGLLSGAIEFSEETAGDVMVPMAELRTLPLGCTPADVEREVARTGYSRFPVVDAAAGPSGYVAAPAGSVAVGADGAGPDRDRPGAARGELIGYLHLKDVIGAAPAQRDQPIPRWRVRALAATGPGAEVEDALLSMQRSGAHLARVAGADGRTLGVVFLEDILEELVGEVRDSMQREAGR